MVFLRLTAASLLPAALTALFYLLEKKTAFAAWSARARQLVIGIAFGAFCVLSTEYGVDTGEGVIMNVRDAGPMCAGLFFGAPAGLLAGLIGGAHRWLCVYWGGGTVTRVACSSATFLAGVLSGTMRRQLFEDKRPNLFSSFGLGATMEVLHMLLVLLTNLGSVSRAFVYVQNCAFTMILCNGIAVCLASLACGASAVRREQLDNKNRHISYDFAFWLFVCVVIAFFATSSFTQEVIYRVTSEDAALYRSVTLYLVIFMEILIFTAIFILVYQMLKTKVVKNLYRVNDGLSAITNGDLDTVVDVRAFREFSELSDHVNATVDTLKRYIREAEERIDQELEFARQIQLSALPSSEKPFPNRPDFDLFASMDAAKEVGGDFYDFYLLDRFTLVFLIADVSGKGIPAAMFMMRAKTLIRDLAESGRPVNEVFTEANRRLCEGNDADMFITAWIGRLDLRTGMLTYANAGHNPPLVRRGGKYEYLRTKPNFVLAGMDGMQYRLNELQLMPGDALYLYTDGVTEAFDESGELFGESRLEALLNRTDGMSAREICGAAAAGLGQFVGGAAQSDDITMLCVRMCAVQASDRVMTCPDEKSFGIVQAFLSDRLTTAGVAAKVQNRMQVANDEIWSNIVRHSGASEAELRLRREGDTVLIDYEDNGRPFDPTAAAAPDVSLPPEERPIGGLGLHMVRKMTSSMAYACRDGRNCLTLGFSIGDGKKP